MKRIISGFLTLVFILGLCSCGEKVATWQEQYDLGMQYLSDGNYEEAVIAFNAAIEIDPKRSEAYLALADAYIAMEDYESAQTTLERALGQVDNSEAIQTKLEELAELLRALSEEESAPVSDVTDGDEGQSQIDSPEHLTASGDDVDEVGHQDEIAEESANIQESEDIVETQQDTPSTEPEQVSNTYKIYQYAIDAVNTATIWDMYMTMEQKSGYAFDSLSVSMWEWSDLCNLIMDYRSVTATVPRVGIPAYVSFGCSVPIEVYAALPGDTDVVREKEDAAQVLALCDSYVIESIHMSYDPAGMKISSAFKDELTYGKIIRICEENGYAYTVSDNELYRENYLYVELGNGKRVDFTWYGYWGEDISDVAPTYCSVY